MENTEKIEELFDQSSDVIKKSKLLSHKIQICVEKIIDSFENGNKILIFGNGGSAADAQHMAAEFIPDLALVSFINAENLASIKLAKAIGASFEKEVEFRGSKWHIYRHTNP